MSNAEENAPWYADGLRFTCTQCGNCCTGAPGAVWIDDDDIQRIADLTGKSIGEVKLFHTRLHGTRWSLAEFANGDCTFLDPETRRCAIYEARPLQCRTWPFWQSHLESPQKWEQVKTICPGTCHGEFVPLEEIEAQANRTAIDQ